MKGRGLAEGVLVPMEPVWKAPGLGGLGMGLAPMEAAFSKPFCSMAARRV